MLAIAAKRALAGAARGGALAQHQSVNTVSTLALKSILSKQGVLGGNLVGGNAMFSNALAATRGALLSSASSSLASSRGIHFAAAAAVAARTASASASSASSKVVGRLSAAVRAELFNVRRLFCAETPKKSGGWENFKPKSGNPTKPTKPGDPEAAAGKAGASSDSSAGGGGGGGGGGSSGGSGPGGSQTIGELFNSMVNNPMFNHVMTMAGLAAVMALFYGGAVRVECS